MFPCFAYPLRRLVHETESLSGISSNRVRAERILPNSECMFINEFVTKRSETKPVFTAMEWTASPGAGEGSREQEVRMKVKVYLSGETEAESMSLKRRSDSLGERDFEWAWMRLFQGIGEAGRKWSRRRPA